MEKHRAIARTAFCLLCALLLVVGCDNNRNDAAQPKVIRKKISGSTDSQAAKSRKAQVETRQTRAPQKPAASPAARPSAPESESASAAARNPVAPEPSPAPVLTTAAQAASQPAAKVVDAAAPKPAPTPKSDIVAAGAKQPRTAVSETPELAAASVPPAYDRKDKIDPFEPLFKEKVAEKTAQKKVKKRAPKTPLERIALSQLKLVGIVTAPRGNLAMVEEASGKGYTIHKGTYIGVNGGRVVRIEPDKVVVAETYEDLSGKTETREVELTILKPPGVL